MAKRSTDLWGYVQREVARGVDGSQGVVRTFPAPVTPTVQLRSPAEGWSCTKHRGRAASQLAALEQAMAANRQRRAARLRAAFLHTVQTDRVAHARRLATDLGLRLDAMGRGPFCDIPTIHYRDRLPWGIFPLRDYGSDGVPDQTADVISTWNGLGEVFDRYFMAHEPPSSHFRTHSLIGAITPDGRSSDWFLLDRWAS